MRRIVFFLVCAPAWAQYAPPAGGGAAIGSALTGGTSCSILYVDASDNLAQAPTLFCWDPTNHQLFVGQNSGTAEFDLLAASGVKNMNITGTTPASVSSGSGTAAPDGIRILSARGGTTTDASSSLNNGGNAGSDFIIEGNGGNSASTSTSGSALNRGGNGGSLNLTAGGGGSSTSVTGAAKGGAGGNLDFTVGDGGTSNSATGAGGTAGQFLLVGGTGGSGSGTGNNGGIGTDVSITAGNGGASINATGGRGGNLTIDAGAGGSGGSAAAGLMRIGITNAGTITIGRTGQLVSFPGLIGSTLHTPASSTEACTAGTIVADASFLYVCTTTNNWKRVGISAF